MNSDILLKIAISKIGILLLLAVLIFSGCGKSAFNPDMPGTDMMADQTPSLAMSTMQISSPNWANGITAAEVTILVKNKMGRKISGAAMTITVTGQNNVVVPCSASDVNGIARCRVYTTTPETKTFHITGSISFSQNVTFDAVQPYPTLMDFVSSGDTATAMTGETVVSASGLVEAPAVVKDSFDVRRIHSTVQSVIVESL